jgi:hypothetical protein
MINFYNQNTIIKNRMPFVTISKIDNIVKGRKVVANKVFS